jgi:hypothetical protein
MAKRQDKEQQQELTVHVVYVRAPNAKDRLSRAIDILLNSAPRNAPQPKLITSGTKEKTRRPAIVEGAEAHNTSRSYDHEG